MAEGLDTRRKIVGREDLETRAREHRARGERIVLVSGEFDLLDARAAWFLELARKEGDVLLVAVDSDTQVRARKGAGRPIVPAQGRAQLVAALRVVDYVIVRRDEEKTSLLEVLRPDVYVPVGSVEETKAECDAARAAGIRVARPNVPGGADGMDLPERLRRLHHV